MADQSQSIAIKRSIGWDSLNPNAIDRSDNEYPTLDSNCDRVANPVSTVSSIRGSVDRCDCTVDRLFDRGGTARQQINATVACPVARLLDPARRPCSRVNSYPLRRHPRPRPAAIPLSAQLHHGQHHCHDELFSHCRLSMAFPSPPEIDGVIVSDAAGISLELA